MTHVGDMTRKQIEAAPSRKWDEDIGPFTSMVILPLRTKHDSGFRCMDFVACKNGQPIARLSGCSDVIHFDGIGGLGLDWLNVYGKCPTMIPPSGWTIDCLGKSGLLHIFCDSRMMKAGQALSSFDIYVVPKERQEATE